MSKQNFNPRHPCGWRQQLRRKPFKYKDISIHATHAGGDVIIFLLEGGETISIHATHAGGDFFQRFFPCAICRFQSTPPMRVATLTIVDQHYIEKISIHATHAGGDSYETVYEASNIYFNPRHPCGWRPDFQGTRFSLWPISIHATHAGGDPTVIDDQRLSRDFNPRHPCGWRRVVKYVNTAPSTFQSTPPMRVATVVRQAYKTDPAISIHATHAGGDSCIHDSCFRRSDFNPRHPCGWRLLALTMRPIG